jgi:predicted alpha/beta hydrolase
VGSEKVSIPARDHYPLGATVFEPAAAESRERIPAAVVVQSAMGARQALYARFAEFLVSQGCAVVTFDYRGIGRSSPDRLRGFPAVLHEWGTRDVAGVLDWTAHRFPSARIAVVGHSVGGQLLGLADNSASVAALIGICAQSGDWRNWPRPRRYRLAATWSVLVPAAVKLFGYLPGRIGVGTPIPAGVASEWARWCRTRGYLARFLGTQDGLPDHFEAFSGPILAFSAADDSLAPREAVEALFRMYRGASAIEHWHVDPQQYGIASIGHFGFFLRSARPLWEQTFRWLEAALVAAENERNPHERQELRCMGRQPSGS